MFWEKHSLPNGVLLAATKATFDAAEKKAPKPNKIKKLNSKLNGASKSETVATANA